MAKLTNHEVAMVMVSLPAQGHLNQTPPPLPPHLRLSPPTPLRRNHRLPPSSKISHPWLESTLHLTVKFHEFPIPKYETQPPNFPSNWCLLSIPRVIFVSRLLLFYNNYPKIIVIVIYNSLIDWVFKILMLYQMLSELATGLEKSEEKIIWVIREASNSGVMNTFVNIKEWRFFIFLKSL